LFNNIKYLVDSPDQLRGVWLEPQKGSLVRRQGANPIDVVRPDRVMRSALAPREPAQNRWRLTPAMQSAAGNIAPRRIGTMAVSRRERREAAADPDSQKNSHCPAGVISLARLSGESIPSPGSNLLSGNSRTR
jgi:hypothetical protein